MTTLETFTSATRATQRAGETTMRYAYEAYKFRGRELFRVIDTFNGGRVVDKGFKHDAQAIGRRDELNAYAVARARVEHGVAYAQTSRADVTTLGAESLKTPRDASAAASLIASACFNDEIKAIVARQLLRSIVRPHDPAIAVQLERAQDATSSLVNAFDRQYRD